jgi:Zn-dependent peptidase ImmA (M78 family)
VDAEGPIVRGTWDEAKLKEIRANTFAAHFLVPRETLDAISAVTEWTPEKAREWAGRLHVNPVVLGIALQSADHIDDATYQEVSRVRIPSESKTDPELPASLSPLARSRKLSLLERGLSDSFVSLCFEGYREGHITRARLAEMLLTDEREVNSIADAYGEVIHRGD